MKHDLRTINEAQLSLILMQIGNVESIKVGDFGQTHSLWSNKVDTETQLRHIMRDLNFLYISFSDMLRYATDNHGEEIIYGMPDSIENKKEVVPFFSIVNSYQYYMEDQITSFYMKNNKNLSDKACEEKIEKIQDSFGLASQTHDSHWSIGIGEGKFKDTCLPLAEGAGSFGQFFNMDDFMIEVRNSSIHEGEKVVMILGREYEYGDLTEKDINKVMEDSFVSFVRENNSIQKVSIESTLDSAYENKEEQTPAKKR